MNNQRTRSGVLRLIVLPTLFGFALVGMYAVISSYFPSLAFEARLEKPKPAVPSTPPITAARMDFLSGQPLLDEMRKGKLVFFMRHFHTDHRKFHEDPIKSEHSTMTLEDFKDSGAQQRHLTEYGRSRAKSTGESLRKLGIPLERVISSPYIRAVEGATLLSGRSPDLITKDLLHRGGDWTAARMFKNITPYLTTVPKSGNVLLMSHRPQMDGIAHIQEGQMFVFRPKGDGTFDMIGGIHDTDWLEAQVSVEHLGRRYAEFTSQGEDK